MRTAFGRGLVAIALVGGVAGLTAACGGDGSTVSSTPSASASASLSASAAAPSASTTAVDPSPSAVAPTAPDEAPTPASDGSAAPERSSRDQAFLGGLTAKGVAFSQNGDVALSAAQYICGAERESSAPEQVRPMVLAIVASDAQLLGKQIDAEAVADTYIATAQATYCNA